MKDPLDSCTRELPAMRTGRAAAGNRRRQPLRDLGWVEELGYCFPRELQDVGVCAVRPMLFTAAIFVDISAGRYAGRYCYETVGAAIAALAAWDGRGDPPGGWIKYKSDTREQLGPGCAVERTN